MGKGTSTASQDTTSSLSAYDPAKGTLDGLLGKVGSMAGGAGTLTGAQNDAINTLTKNGQAGNATAGSMLNGAFGLLNGGGATSNNGAITGNLNDYKGLLADTASGGGSNPALKAQLDQITTDATNSINSQWAAAGRDGSPGNFQALGRGIASGVAPVMAAQYNTDKDRALNAAKSVYDAGNSTYGILNSRTDAANSNIVNGVGVGNAAFDAGNQGANATLEAQAKLFGIPASQLMTLLGTVSPVAAQFGTQTGHGTSEKTMSDADLLSKGISNATQLGALMFGA